MSEYDVAIIGGGPAGLAAAAYLRRAALRRTVLIAESLGGKVYYPFSLRDLPSVEHVWGGDLCAELEQFVKDQLLEIEQTMVKRVVIEDDLFHMQLADDREIVAAQRDSRHGRSVKTHVRRRREAALGQRRQLFGCQPRRPFSRPRCGRRRQWAARAGCCIGIGLHRPSCLPDRASTEQSCRACLRPIWYWSIPM